MTKFTKLHPKIQAEFKKQELDNLSRLWFVLRGLDTEGRGAFRVRDIYQIVCDKENEYYMFTRRQLRRVLSQGDGLTWTIKRGKHDQLSMLYLRGIVFVCEFLGLDDPGAAALVPIEDLTNSVKSSRRAALAATHATRKHKHNPISRETVDELTGIKPRTQINLENDKQLKHSKNYAIGHGTTVKSIHKRSKEKAFSEGRRGVFTLFDPTGLHGKKGREYVAWQLPNSYQTIYKRATSGRRRKIKRAIGTLVNKEKRGTLTRLFYDKVDGLKKARKQHTETYFSPTGGGFWFVNL